MEVVRKQRKIQRQLFTKSWNNFNAKYDDVNASHKEKLVALELLEKRMTDLEAVNSNFNNLLFESDASEEDIENEMESHEAYILKFLTARSKLVVPENENRGRNGGTNVQIARSEKPFKKSTLEIPKFSGSVGTWLHFWSHFRKIHENNEISKEDKSDYLKHAMEKNSKAEKVVGGYPTTAENYDKAFDSLRH